jgi:uncharacterized protein YwqG
MPFFNTIKDLEKCLNAANAQPEFAHYLVEMARPCLKFMRKPWRDAEIPLGASKIGGDPDMPLGMRWPTRPPYPDADERDGDFLDESFPLPFICQLDLEDLSRHGEFFHPLLPKEGRLLVFIDVLNWYGGGVPTDRVAMRLIWDSSPRKQLTRRPSPDTLVEHCQERAPSWQTSSWIDLASAWALEVHPMYSVTECWTERYPVDHPASRNFGKCYSELKQLSHKLFRPTTGQDFGDHLGGWPEPLQDDPRNEAQLLSHGIEPYSGSRSSREEKLLEQADEWQLVLSLSLEAAEGIRIAYGENTDAQLFVMMREKDLKAARFKKVWMVAQTT